MPKDEFHIHGMSEDSLVGVRKTDTEECEIRFTPTVEGQSIPPGSEVVRLKPRVGTMVADVETVYKAEEPAAKASKGPAKVSTKAYRESWDRIYGQKGSKVLN